jgi:colanic acid/amylovoran biosynthesis protein
VRSYPIRPCGALLHPCASSGGTVPVLAPPRSVRALRIPAEGSFPASVRDLARCDALVDLAGVSFIDGREKFLPFNILTILPAMLLGVPVYKLAQAMGPFEGGANRLSARLLRRCALVVPRGERTIENLRSIGFPAERMLPGPDVAFAYEERDSLSDEGAAEVHELLARIDASHATLVGVCPSSVIASKAAKQEWDYPGFLAEVVSGLLDDGHQVLLFPNATKADRPDTGRNNDLPVIAEVASRLAAHPASDRLLAVRGDVNAAGLRRLVEACSCVAVSRFHAMVGALALGKPVVVLGWSHKYAEVMEQFGLGEWAFDHSEHDPQAFLARVRELVDARESLAERVNEHLPEIRERTLAQFRAVAEGVRR